MKPQATFESYCQDCGCKTQHGNWFCDVCWNKKLEKMKCYNPDMTPGNIGGDRSNEESITFPGTTACKHEWEIIVYPNTGLHERCKKCGKHK